jgi:hypothetical protein
MLNIYVAGADRTNILLSRTLSISDSIQGIDSCNFALVGRTSGYRPNVHELVEVRSQSIRAPSIFYYGEPNRGALTYSPPPSSLATISFQRESSVVFGGDTLGSNIPRINADGIYMESEVAGYTERMQLYPASFQNSFGSKQDSRHFSLGATIKRTTASIKTFNIPIYFQNNTVTRELFQNASVANGAIYQFSFFIGKSGSVPISTGANASSNFQVVINGTVVTTGITVESLPNSGWTQNLYRVYVNYTAASTGTVAFGVRLSTANAASEFWVANFNLKRRHPTIQNLYQQDLIMATGATALASYSSYSNVTQSGANMPIFIGDIYRVETAGAWYKASIDCAGRVSIRVVEDISDGTKYEYVLNTDVVIANNQKSRVAISADNGIGLIAINGVVFPQFVFNYSTNGSGLLVRFPGDVSAIYSDISFNTRPLDPDKLKEYSRAVTFVVNVDIDPATTDASDYQLIAALNALSWPYDATEYVYIGEFKARGTVIERQMALYSARSIYGGFVDGFDEKLMLDGSNTIQFNIECSSYAQILGKRLVAESYDNQGVSTIISDIRTKYISGDIDSVDFIGPNTTLATIRFNYQSVSDCLNMLAEITGAIWFVDAYRVLHFWVRESVDYYDAAFFMSDTTRNFLDVKVRNTAQDYRNRQYVRAGLGLSTERTEKFVGNGQSTSASTSYPIAKQPTFFQIGGVNKTIGIREVEAGKDAYWGKGSEAITFAVAPTNGTIIEIRYQGQYPIITQSIDEEEVLRLKTSQGGLGSGFSDHLQDEPDIETTAAAIERGVSLLRKYAKIPRIATIRTFDPIYYQPGTLVGVDIAAHAMTGNWLIESVRTTDINGSKLIYEITLLDGEAVGGWQNYFGGLKRSTRKLNFRDNEVILLSRNQIEQVRITDTFTVVVT